MREEALVLLSRNSWVGSVLKAAMEPVGDVRDSFPLHPDDRPPGFDEFKQKRKRIPRPERSSEDTDGKHPDPDHQIDEYA